MPSSFLETATQKRIALTWIVLFNSVIVKRGTENAWADLFNRLHFLDIPVHYANASGIALRGGEGGIGPGRNWSGGGELYLKGVGHEKEYKYFDEEGFF